MATENKKYEMFVQFDSIKVTVSAKNKREAKKKAIEKVKAISAHKVMDKKNCFLDEAP